MTRMADGDNPPVGLLLCTGKDDALVEYALGGYAMYGRIAVHWQREADRLKLDVTIPVNTTATVYVPTSDVQGITESDTPASKGERFRFLRNEAGAAVFEVPSGNYRFEAPM